MYSIRRCTVVCLKLVYLFTNIGNVNNKHCSQYSDVTSLMMVVGLSVDLLSPACVSHQGLLGNPNLTVAQILWILHIFPLIFKVNNVTYLQIITPFFFNFCVVVLILFHPLLFSLQSNVLTIDVEILSSHDIS